MTRLNRTGRRAALAERDNDVWSRIETFRTICDNLGCAYDNEAAFMAAYDDALQRSVGALTTGQRVAAAIRERKP